MPSDEDRRRLKDILINIELANTFVAGLDYDRFFDNAQAFYAVIRCLEVISEASRRLSDELKSRHPHLPWRKIAGSGNIYRHDYEDVQHRLVWGTVKEFLPDLKEMVDAELHTDKGAKC